MPVNTGGKEAHTNEPADEEPVRELDMVNQEKSKHDEPTMQIYVMAASGEKIVLDIDPSETVNALKRKIETKKQIPPDQQRLIFGGKTLDNRNFLSVYNIKDQSTLLLATRHKRLETIENKDIVPEEETSWR